LKCCGIFQEVVGSCNVVFVLFIHLLGFDIEWELCDLRASKTLDLPNSFQAQTIFIDEHAILQVSIQQNRKTANFYKLNFFLDFSLLGSQLNQLNDLLDYIICIDHFFSDVGKCFLHHKLYIWFSACRVRIFNVPF